MTEDAEVTITLNNANGSSIVENGTAATWALGVNTLTITVIDGSAQDVYTVAVTKV